MTLSYKTGESIERWHLQFLRYIRTWNGKTIIVSHTWETHYVEETKHSQGNFLTVRVQTEVERKPPSLSSRYSNVLVGVENQIENIIDFAKAEV
jgi:hypothetical protein